VVVNFGRIGTERAVREAEKLIAEKLRKGYQEQRGSITPG
jgi:predicted DNA-binding WGR domain protein